MKESPVIQTERARLQVEWDKGCEEGYYADPNNIPDFFGKPYFSCTPRQRGYIFGREIRLQDMPRGIGSS